MKPVPCIPSCHSRLLNNEDDHTRACWRTQLNKRTQDLTDAIGFNQRLEVDVTNLTLTNQHLVHDNRLFGVAFTEVHRAVGAMLPERLDPTNRVLHDKAYEVLRKLEREIRTLPGEAL